MVDVVSSLKIYTPLCPNHFIRPDLTHAAITSRVSFFAIRSVRKKESTKDWQQTQLAAPPAFNSYRYRPFFSGSCARLKRAVYLYALLLYTAHLRKKRLGGNMPYLELFYAHCTEYTYALYSILVYARERRSGLPHSKRVKEPGGEVRNTQYRVNSVQHK